MRRAKVWTTKDLKQVYELVGKIPPREIRRKLRLSKRQLYYACELLRKQGKNVTLRCYTSRLDYCPACGCRRSTLGSYGICEPCRKTKQLEDIKYRSALIFEQLPMHERAVYEETDTEIGSNSIPMPKPRSLKGLNSYERAKAIDDYDLAMEQWSIANLTRQVKSAQKRKERMEKKLKESRNHEKEHHQ